MTGDSTSYSSPDPIIGSERWRDQALTVLEIAWESVSEERVIHVLQLARSNHRI